MGRPGHGARPAGERQPARIAAAVGRSVGPVKRFPADGVFVSSDSERFKHLFLVRATDFIALCRDIGVEDVYGTSMVRGADGQLKFTEILATP
jgi:hypothetical protein